MESLLTAAIFAIAILTAIYIAYRQGKSPAETRSDIEIAAGAAYRLVLAAEQLARTQQLPAAKRLDWVMMRLTEIYPDIDEKTLRTVVESVVGEINELRKR